jgi:hypothetical protein
MPAQAAALVLAEELKITRAAERLRITQPALSKQIVELESRLGFPVFIRGQKRIELTDAGKLTHFESNTYQQTLWIQYFTRVNFQKSTKQNELRGVPPGGTPKPFRKEPGARPMHSR